MRWASSPRLLIVPTMYQIREHECGQLTRWRAASHPARMRSVTGRRSSEARQTQNVESWDEPTAHAFEESPPRYADPMSYVRRLGEGTQNHSTIA